MWTKRDTQAAIAIPLILIASVFFGGDAEATQQQKYYPLPERYVDYEQCVRMRESQGQWDVTSPSGTYLGAYQMSQAIANGATWWMLRFGDLATYLGTQDKAKQRIFAQKLRATPVNEWDPWLQTAAFRRTLDGHGAQEPWAGASHWAGGRWICTIPLR